MLGEKTRVIALLGPAGSGKSSVSQYLIDNYGAKRYSLAGPLKEVAKRTLNFSDNQLYGTQEQKEAIDPRYGFSCRWFLQKLGTDGCRGVFGLDFWTNMLMTLVAKEAPQLAVIDDTRFISEAEVVQFNPFVNGHVWKLWPVDDDEAAARARSAGSHVSESEWISAPCDENIRPKARGLGTLYAAVDDIMRRYK